MNFKKAANYIMKGYKIRRKGWDKYWVLNLQLNAIIVHTKNGRAFNVKDEKDYVSNYWDMDAKDWEVVPE